MEHRQYTKPAVWRGIAVPDVLLVRRPRQGGPSIAATKRWPAPPRFGRTLIAALDCKALDKADRKTLMALGWEVSAAHPRRLAD